MNNPALRALDHEFTVAKTMRPETYAEKRALIIALEKQRIEATPAQAPAPAPATDPVTYATLGEVLEPLVNMIAEKIRSEDAKVISRIEALESTPKRMHYRGIRSAHETCPYLVDQFATHNGSLWACLKSNTHSRPGTDSDWQLSAKGK